jgi:hypothetical protein
MVRGLPLVLVAACGFHPGARSDGNVAADAPDAGAGDWWNPAWRVRIPLAIANTSTDSLAAGYQVGLSYDVGATPCTPNRDDPRILYGATELTRVIDEVGPPEWTWFPLQAPLAAGATSTGEYWLYCGNTAPGPAPADPTLLFDLYDAFDSIDAAVWTTNQTVAATGGELMLGGATTENGIVSNTLFSPNHALDFVATSGATTGQLWWGGFQNGTGDSAPWVLWWTPTNTAMNPAFQGLQSEAIWNGTAVPLDTAPHLYGLEKYAASARYRREDVPIDAHAYAGMTSPPDMMSVRLWNRMANTVVAVDWARVRQAVDPPPAVTAGTPELR